MSIEPIHCDYCKKPAELKHGDGGWFWECAPCDARVSAYSNSPSKRPMGTFANAELRKERWHVYVELDSMIRATQDKMQRKKGKVTGKIRANAFQWLAKELGIEPSQCDYSKFTLGQCQAALEVLKRSTPAWMNVNN